MMLIQTGQELLQRCAERLLETLPTSKRLHHVVPAFCSQSKDMYVPMIGKASVALAKNET